MTPEQRLASLVAAERAQTPSSASAQHGFERLQEALVAHVPPIDIGPIDPTLLAGSTTMGELVTGKLVTGTLAATKLAKVTAVVGTVVTSGVLLGNQIGVTNAPDQTPAAVAGVASVQVSPLGDRRARAHAASAGSQAPVDNALRSVPHAAARQKTAHERASAHERAAFDQNTRSAEDEALAAAPDASETAAASASVKAFADVPASQSASAPSFDAELVLIRRAKAEFDAGRDHLARVWLTEHAQRFPRGVFAAEREGLTVLSICRSSPAAGQGSALAFLQRYPQSPLAARVRHTCGLE